MNAMTLLRIVVPAAIVFSAYPSSSASAAPPVVNRKLAATYRQLAQDMGDEALNLDRAAQTVAELAKTDADNAFQHYAAARLHAWNEKWDDVLAEVDAGNKAPFAIQYQLVDGPSAVYPLNATMRQMARAVAQAVPKLGAEKVAPLMSSMRTLTRKVAWSEPRSALPLLVGAALRAIVRNGLVALHAAGSPEAIAAQKAVDDDRAFARQVSEDGRSLFGEDSAVFPTIVRKHGLTPEQVLAYHNGGRVTPAVSKKMLAIKKEFNPKERAWVAKWLKQLPE